MRYALISDIHGNLEALEAVLLDIKKERIDAIYCLGDIVGYYPEPEKCVNLVMKNAKSAITGNHDYAAIGRIDIHNTFTRYACIAMEWTQKHLSRASIAYLADLPLTQVIDKDILLAHSTPSNPDGWAYLFMDSDELVFDAFSSFSQRICFNAHTHYPVIMTLQDDKIILHKEKRIRLVPDQQYLINVGSVGQPRDRDPRSCYAIYDKNMQEVTLKRVEYDYKTTQMKVRKEGLPEFLAQRLKEGR